MKFLKTLLIILGSLAIIALLLMLLAPREKTLSRSIRIKAPKATVFKHVKTFENRKAWYPWMKLDPAMETSFEGEDGTVGAKYSWSGNELVGIGEQVITAVVENEQVDTRLTFLEPYESSSDTYFKVADEGEETMATWSMKAYMPVPMNLIGLFMNFEKAVGSDYEKGLKNLKEVCESEAARTFRGYEVKEIDFPATGYVVKKAKLSFDEVTPFYAKHFPAIASSLASNGKEMTGMPSGLFFEWDDATQQTDMAAGCPTAHGTEIPGYETLNIDAGKAFLINYYGSYGGSEEAHYAMDDYMKAHNIEPGLPVIEEYVTDPEQEPDPSKWLTRIYYFSKK